MSQATDKAISHINKNGVLLVFPLKGRADVPSLWKAFHPRTPMRWEWTDDADDKVVRMWQLMKELSFKTDIVYSKWFQGRATFFSRDLFVALLRWRLDHSQALASPPQGVRAIAETLRESSPLSTKELKAATDLQGASLASIYGKALSWLFTRFEVVGCGERDDGAFPSLLIGASELIFEDLWEEARSLPSAEALARIDHFMPASSPFRRSLDRVFG
ncbi:MAG: hypothetical protein AB7F86_20410 [Bdellovibrionales bacterium]